jgi:uncharacterized surface protein with fasciclin (FAS1) repeats
MGILKSTGMSLQQALANPTLIAAVLQYHVVLGVAAKAKDLKDKQKLPTALPGTSLTVDLASQKGKVVIVGATNKAVVVKADIGAGKAVMHLIDAALFPTLK